MKDSLADSLNLTGTARHNLSIRQKLRLAALPTNEETQQQRSLIPAAWESVVPFYNHSELRYINNLAKEAGMQEMLPFKNVEALVEDTGEVFFSKYLDWLTTTKPRSDEHDLCNCRVCAPTLYENETTNANNNPPEHPPERQQDQPTQQSTSANATIPQPITQAPVVPPLAVQAPYLPYVFPPMPWYNPFLPIQPAPGFCCNKYRLYCFRADRRGRPPHDSWCSSRR